MCVFYLSSSLRAGAKFISLNLPPMPHILWDFLIAVVTRRREARPSPQSRSWLSIARFNTESPLVNSLSSGHYPWKHPGWCNILVFWQDVNLASWADKKELFNHLWKFWTVFIKHTGYLESQNLTMGILQGALEINQCQNLLYPCKFLQYNSWQASVFYDMTRRPPTSFWKLILGKYECPCH